MAALLAGVVIALISATSGVVTVVMARRSAKDATKVEDHRSFRDDFVAFVDALKNQVDRLEATVTERDRQIDLLQREVEKCEAERKGDHERIHALEARVAELGG